MSDLKKGENSIVKSYLRYISKENMADVDEFVLNSLVRDYDRFSSPLEVETMFSGPGYITYEDASSVRRLTGFNYFDINSALRGRWSYDENGHVNRKDEFLELATKVKSIIAANPSSFDNFVAYRGVSLSYFSEYGIETLEDLVSLEGNFMIDMGFVSTSLLEDKTFFKKNIESGKEYNVMIEYMVPSDFTDGIYVGGKSGFSYHPDEYEYLINAGNMSKVTSVQIGDDGTARVKAVMVPKHLYDDYYKSESTTKK